MAGQEMDVVHNAELRTCEYELLRGNSGYGFTLSGECPSVVTSVLADSPAEETGLLPGLLLLEVDGVDVSRARHEEVVGLVARSRGVVRLVCSEPAIEVNELVSDQRSSSAGRMNEHAALSRKMSSPSSEESLSLSQAIGGPFIPAEGAKNESNSRVLNQRQSLMLALASGHGDERVKSRPRTKTIDERACSEEPETRVTDRQEILKLGYAVLRFPVAYFGSVQVTTTKLTPQASVETIRRCVARVQAEGRCAPVTLEATSSGVCLINPHGRLLIDIPAHHLAYSGICIDDARFFAIVTRRPKRFEKASLGHRHPVCHVFMVEGPRKSASQDDLNQSAQGTSHILKSIASILRTSKSHKGGRLQNQATENTNIDHTGSGSSDGQQSGMPQSGVYMIGRTVSVDSISGEKLPNRWTGTSDPDLLSIEKRHRPFDRIASPSLPTDLDFLGRHTDHVSDLQNQIDDKQQESNDNPPDEYPEEWEVSNQQCVVDLPPPPPELFEPPPIMQDEDHVQSIRQQSELPRQSGLDRRDLEMSSRHGSNIDKAAVHQHLVMEKSVQEVPPPIPVRADKRLPAFFHEDYPAELQSMDARRGRVIEASSKEKGTLHSVASDNHMRGVTIDTGRQQRRRGVKGGASFDLEEEPPLSTGSQDHNHTFSKMQQEGTLLSTSMDSLALMSTVGSEYSVRDDVGRIASWALSLTRLLKDPEGVACLKEFMRSEHSDENLLFWLECQDFAEAKDPKVLQEQVRSIYGKFLSPTAPTPVNIDYHSIQRVAENLDCPQREIFMKAQREVFRLMKMDCHPRFVRSTLYQQCVVAEMEGLPLPIDPPSPRAKPNTTTKTKETRKVRVRSSSFIGPSSSEKAAGDTPAQAQSNSSISSGYSSQGEERRKKEKEKKKSVLWGWRKSKKSHSNEDLDEEAGGRSSTATEGSEEGHVDESKRSSDVLGAANEQMFRAIMPDCSSTIVVAKHGHTVREALESLFERRNLEFGLLDVVIQSNGEVVPYEAPVSCLHNKEVRLQRAGLSFKAAFPDDGLVTVKVNKKKTIREVLCGVMAERGLEIDSYVVHLDNCPVPLQLDITSSLLVNQSVIIKPATQLTCGSDEDESPVGKSVSPDRGYQSERASSSLSTQSEKSSAFKFKLRIPGLRGSTDLELEARKQELRRAASNDISAIGQQTAVVPPSPGRHRAKRLKDKGEESKKTGKNRKSSKKKGKEEKISKEEEISEKEMANGFMRPVPSAEDLISLLNRVQCDRLDDQRTGLPEPGPLPDLLLERTHSQADMPDRAIEVPQSPRSFGSDGNQTSTLPRSAKEVRQRPPTSVTFRDEVGKPEAPYIRPPDVPPDNTWLPHQGNEQSLSVPDLCPVDDPTFAYPPDFADVNISSTPVSSGRVNHTPNTHRPTDHSRHRRRDLHPVFVTPISHEPSRSSHRFNDGSTDGRRVDRSERPGRSNKVSPRRRTARTQPVFDEWMQALPRDRLAGENSLDSSAVSETSVTFV